MSKPESRYIVGIDLGTTNSALAYIDTRGADARAPRILKIPQWETEGAVVQADMLPSFFVLPPKAEWKRGQLRLPLHRGDEPPDFAVGRLARLKASQVPGRVIHSAKSWLCHPGVDREARLLPWHSDEIIGDERRSPIEVSAAYLAHLKDAWDHEVAQGREAERFEAQDVTITVPASFDEAAQRLTLEAAEKAGYKRERIRLLEEPQAAFYHWLSGHEVAPAGTVLICDVGGGTSDFSLFQVEPQGEGQPPAIKRIAVSDHLLLGGDNIDLSLAHILEKRLVGAGRRLSSRQWAQLVFETRRLKEKALTDLAAGADAGAPGEELFVSIAGEGASLFATAMTASLTRREIEEHVLGGFVPNVPRDAAPKKAARGALQQLGLPYAQDSAITRHLAAFLGGRDVDAVLYTGGTLKPEVVRDALTAQITAWQGRAPLVLENDAMDLAVALGAAAYGSVLRRTSGRITGGYARSLYVEVASPDGHSLVCVVPKGFEGGAPLRLDTLQLKLLTDRPARFQLFSSPRRDRDKAGDVLRLDADEFHPLPPVHTRLDFSGGGEPRLIAVGLEVVLQETGVLQLFCVHQGEGGAGRRWQLDFNVRGAALPDDAEAAPAPVASTRLPAPKLAYVTDKLEHYFGKKKKPEFEKDNPKYLVRDLEEALGVPREEWDTPFLRSLWPHLEPGINRRSRSVGHEVSWLYLAGYALRPGYGYELDEWRVADLFKAFNAGMSFPKERQVEEQWWLMWRRVAGGLTQEQQARIFERIFPALRKGEVSSAEIYILAGSLERIEMGDKVRLGNHLAQQIAGGRKQFLDQRIWALARIASRVPLYGGPHLIVRPAFVEKWWRELAPLDMRTPPYSRLLLFLAQAGRVVQDREFDLPDALRREFLKKMEASGATAEQMRVVREYVLVDTAARTQLFGESLPAGLVLG